MKCTSPAYLLFIIKLLTFTNNLSALRLIVICDIDHLILLYFPVMTNGCFKSLLYIAGKYDYNNIIVVWRTIISLSEANSNSSYIS